jgi:hypothetical protein
MSRALAIIGMLIAFLILLVFVLDLAIKLPFGGASAVMDICMIVGAVILAYLGWSAYREQV